MKRILVVDNDVRENRSAWVRRMDAAANDFQRAQVGLEGAAVYYSTGRARKALRVARAGVEMLEAALDAADTFHSGEPR
jgi:hypothetical protein